MEGYRQLLLCLESHREGTGNNISQVAAPQTYFEGDLLELKQAVDSASDAMLDSMDLIAEAKRGADTTWTHQVSDGTVAFQSAIAATPPKATPPKRAKPKTPPRMEPSLATPKADTSMSGSVQRLLDTIGTPQERKQSAATRKREEMDLNLQLQRPLYRGSPKRQRTPQKTPQKTVRSPEVRRGSPKRTGGHIGVGSLQGGVGSVGVRRAEREVEAAPVQQTSGGSRVPSFLLRADGTKMTPQEYKMRNQTLLKSIQSERRG